MGARSEPYSAAVDERLPRCRRVTRSAEFRKAYSLGNRQVGRTMVMWTLPADSDTSPRMGVVASRKVGHAVARARARRMVRETFRRERYQLTNKQDLIIVSRRNILTTSLPEIRAEFLRLAKRLGLLDTPDKEASTRDAS